VDKPIGIQLFSIISFIGSLVANPLDIWLLQAVLPLSSMTRTWRVFDELLEMYGSSTEVVKDGWKVST
jgi:hypothetical protein